MRNRWRLALVTCVCLCGTALNAEAKKKWMQGSISGVFAPGRGVEVTPGAPFAAEGWEVAPSKGEKARWALLPMDKWVVQLDAGCALKTSAGFTKGNDYSSALGFNEGQRYFAAVNVYGWDGQGAPPCSISFVEIETGKVIAASPDKPAPASIVRLRYPFIALGNRGPSEAAIDGDASSDWRCTVTSPGQRPWLLVDMGRFRDVKGIRYTPPAGDAGAAVKDFEVLGSFNSYIWQPLCAGTFQKPSADRKPQVVMFPELPEAERLTRRPVRYIKLLCKSSMDGGPTASLAELELLGPDGKPITAEPEDAAVHRCYFTVPEDVAAAVAAADKELSLVVTNNSPKAVAINEISMWSHPADQSKSFGAGILGFRGGYWPAETCIAVLEVRKQGPAAEAGLLPGDLIMGINDTTLLPGEINPDAGWFLRSHESTVGRAVVAAMLDGSRKIEFAVLRQGKALKIPVALPDTPSFTDTFPFDCPLADAMQRDMASYSAKHLEKKGLSGDARSIVQSTYAFLGVLGSRDPRYGPLLQKAATDLAATRRSGIGLSAWYCGAAGVALCEYYLATGDEGVLPWIEETLAYFPQTADFSQWGHPIYGHHPGQLPYGGKSLIAPSVAVLAFDALGADRIGVKSETWETIEAYVRAGWSDPERGGHGGQGYGHSPSIAQSWFRTGGVALGAKIRGYDRLSQGRALYLNNFHWAMRDNHAYGPQGATWGLLGFSVADPEGFRSMMRRYAWHLVLSWEPGVGMHPSTYHMGCSYMDPWVIMNGGYGAVLSAKHEGLHVTGATDTRWLKLSAKTHASAVFIIRDAAGTVSFRPQVSAAEIHYTLNGSEPTRTSPLYTEPFPLPGGGIVAVRAYDGAGEAGPVTTESFGTPRKGWTVVRRLPLRLFGRMFDGDPYTYYETARSTQLCKVPPHHIYIELPSEIPLLGVRIVQRKDNFRDCQVKQCSLLAPGADKDTFTTLAEGEIPLGKTGELLLKEPIVTKSLIFSVDSTFGNAAWSSWAELYAISPEPQIFWDANGPGARIEIHKGYPVRYTLDGTVPDAKSTLYDGGVIKGGAGSVIIARVVMANGWLGRPVRYDVPSIIVSKYKTKVYHLGRNQKPDFAAMKPVSEGEVDAPSAKYCRRFNGAVSYDATITAADPLKVQLWLNADDSGKLYIDGKVVLDCSGPEPPIRKEATVSLSRGLHTLRIEHYQGYKEVALDFGYQVK